MGELRGKKAKVDKNWRLGFESSHACRPRNVSSRDRCVNGLTTRRTPSGEKLFSHLATSDPSAFFARPRKSLCVSTVSDA